MKTLSGLTAALLLSAYCCTALASGADEANREFIRQQESFSQQLRGQDNAPLRQMLEQQVRQNPLSADDALSRLLADRAPAEAMPRLRQLVEHDVLSDA